MENILEQETRELLIGCIYKYSPFSYLERTLRDFTLGFTPLKDFNDIYESEYRLTHFFESTEEMDKWTSTAVTPFDKIKKLSKHYLNDFRVTCFSHSAVNNLMWSHYSDNHKGVCFCFDFKNKTKTPFDPVNIIWGNVIYSSLIPEIQVFQNSTTEGILCTLLDNVILTKSSEWAYEKEIRFFLRQKENFLHYLPSSLKAIIVGRRTSDNDIKEIRKFISLFEKNTGHRIQLLFAHRVASKYDLGISADKGFRDNSENSFNCRIPVLPSIKTPIVTENQK